MAQIVNNGKVTTLCNLKAVQVNGNHYDDIPDINTVWLIDTTNSCSNDGTGKYDAYIIGDDIHTAGYLAAEELKYIDPKVPTSLSELSTDSLHRTVTDAEKQVWNSGAGGEGTVINNSDDIVVIADEDTASNHLQFANKQYDTQVYSGQGKIYLRKNVYTESERTIIDISPAIGSEDVSTSEDPDETPDKFTSKYIDLSDGVGGTAVERNRVNVTYLRKEVSANDSFIFRASTKGAIYKYFWGVIDKVTNEIYQVGGELPSDENITSHLSYATINLPTNVESAYFIINVVSYDSAAYYIKEAKKLDNIKEFNILETIIEPNTTFIVSYDYNLNGRILELPENSILKFDGGSINNGFIVGNNTIIEAGSHDNIFGRDIEIAGTWKTNTWYARWFGVYADGIQDDTKILQKMLDIAEATNSRNTILNWYDCTFRTTKGLFIKSYTTILGGKIKAKFDNPLDWVLQTYCLYGGRKVVRYNGLLAFDQGKATQGGFIKDLTINGELNDNGDGTWAPIFGGIRIQSSGMDTENVSIYDVGYGFARANSVMGHDTNLLSWCYFNAYTAWYVICLQVDTCYFQAHAHHTSSGPDDPYKCIPYAREYQPVDADGNLFGAFEDTYMDGNGGIDDTDSQLLRPKLTAMKFNYATAIFNNTAMDYYQEVAVAVHSYCQIQFNTISLEAVGQCYFYNGGHYNKITFNTILESIHSKPTYDIYINKGTATLNLISAETISCKGQGDNTTSLHKLYKGGTAQLAVNILGRRTDVFPNSPDFHFESGGQDSIKLVPNGYENIYTLGNGKYLLPSDISKDSNVFNNLVIDADTIVIFNGLALSKKNIIVSGVNRNTSILKITNAISMDNTKNEIPSIEFKNLTIDCSSVNGRFISYSLNGVGGNITFTKCNIIVGSREFIWGDSKYSMLFNITFVKCNIYSKIANVLGPSIVNIDDTQYNNLITSPIVKLNNVSNNCLRNSIVQFPNRGITEHRNLITYHLGKGHMFSNVDTGRLESWNGRQWVMEDGYPYIADKGSAADIPALPAMKVGSIYNDTTNNLTKKLISNGTCGYGLFSFNILFPKVDRTFYIGTTAVTPTNGAFSVNIPSGTYFVSCPGYDCYPSTVTITDNSTVTIYQKASKFTNTFKIKITATDGNDNILTNLVIRVGGVLATVPSGKDYYEVNLPTGDYQIMAEGYADQTPLKVNGLADSVTAVFTTEASSQTVTLDGYLYSHDNITDSNDTNIVAGNYAVDVDNTSLSISVTTTDLNTILYFINDSLDAVKKSLAALLLKKWFEAGHYGELSGNNVKLYSDTVGSTTGNIALFTDTNTNLECAVTHTAGTNATWEEVSSGGSGASDTTEIVSASGTALTAQLNKYYRFDSAVNTLAITLPAMSGITTVKAISFEFTTGSTPNITFTAADSKTIVYYDGYDVSDASTEYEITCLFNGSKWIVSRALMATNN